MRIASMVLAAVAVCPVLLAPLIGTALATSIVIAATPADTERIEALNREVVSLINAGKYVEAEARAREALALAEELFGPDHILTAVCLNNLAELYRIQGRYVEAEPLYDRALAIRERALGPNHPATAASLNNLASLYRDQGRYREAEPLFKRAIVINENNLGPDHPATAETLNRLAELYLVQGRYAEAEPLFRRSLAIREKTFGPNDPTTAGSLSGLASLYVSEGRYAEAESLLKRALSIYEEGLGLDHPATAIALNNLAEVYRQQGRNTEAEPLYIRALAIKEKAFGVDHPSTAASLNNLAGLYLREGRYAEAEPLFKRALSIYERALGFYHPATAIALNNLAELFRRQGRDAEAEPLYKRALAIKEKAFGRDHPSTADGLNNLASLYFDQRRYAKAEPLFSRALAIWERSFGPNHPKTAISLGNLAFTYGEQGKFAAALPLTRRAVGLLARRFDSVESSGVKSELQASRFQFVGALRVFSGSRGLPGESEAKLSGEAFDAAQWGRGSEAGEALQKMAARSAAGPGEFGKAVSERETILARLKFLDGAIVAAASKPANQRYAPTEEAWRKEAAEQTQKLAANDELLKKRFPKFYALTSQAPLGASDAAKLLRSKEALVAYALGGDSEDASYVFVLKSDGSLAFLDLNTKGSVIAREVDALREALDLTGVSDVSRLKAFDVGRAQKLYETIFKPAETHLQGIENVILVPDGKLESLPFQVLVTKAGSGTGPDAYRSSDWLSDRYGLTVLPSVISLKALRSDVKISTAKDPFLGFGDPAFTGTVSSSIATRQMKGGTKLRSVSELKRLESTEREIRAMAKALGANESSIVLGANASEKTVRDLNAKGRLKQARVVAFATHALVPGEIEGLKEPAIALTPPGTLSPAEDDDGLLKASEITDLALDADWVVLSACNTASGDDEPGARTLSGLARAFFYAGSRSLLVSHWPVDAEASEKLIRSLFDPVHRKLPRAVALTNAMRDLRRDPDALLSHPAFWAPFSITGEGK